MILSDLYGWDKEITPGNWREIDALIAARYEDSFDWAGHILKKANVSRFVTEYTRKTGDRPDGYMQFSLEWAFFTRNQWGQYDTALLELENAWGCEQPGNPLPVTAGSDRSFLKKHIAVTGDVHTAMKSYCSRIPYESIGSIAHHFSCDITYGAVTEREMDAALAGRLVAGEKERDIYANYLFDLYLTELENRADPPPLIFSLGAEPLPFETGSKLSSKTIFELASLFAGHPRLSFVIFLSSASHNQGLATLCRELPNLSLAGYWWHNFFPDLMRRVMGERIDMLPSNKNVGFFSDAYCVDWLYAKSMIVRRNLAKVLAEKIEYGQMSFETALEYAYKTMNELPSQLFHMKESILL